MHTKSSRSPKSVNATGVICYVCIAFSLLEFMKVCVYIAYCISGTWLNVRYSLTRERSDSVCVSVTCRAQFGARRK